MTDSRRAPLAAVILAAGAGTRLRPLTTIRPKALCPVNNVPLVDLALARAKAVTDEIAVNVHHDREAMENYLDGRVHLSIEIPIPLGTAGALGNLREWIAGRDVLVLNVDGWNPSPLTPFVAGWDRRTVRLMTVVDAARGDFGSQRYCGAALMPWSEVADLPPEPAGLYDVSWAPALADGRLELVETDTPFFDCGTVADYHAANMAASGGENVVGPGAVVEGRIERTVLWENVRVDPGEELVDAIRPVDGVTINVDPVMADEVR